MRNFFLLIGLVVLSFSSGRNEVSEKVSQVIMNQSGSIIFDSSNAYMGCSTNGVTTNGVEETRERGGNSLVFGVSDSYSDEKSSQFQFVFNPTQGSITGDLAVSYYRNLKEGGYNSSELIVNIPSGEVVWDQTQNVWIFNGAAEMDVHLDIYQMVASYGDEKFFGAANVKTQVTGHVFGASGPYESLDHHGEIQQNLDGEFRIIFESKDVVSEGSGEIKSLNVECWLNPNNGYIEDFFAGVTEPGEPEAGQDTQEQPDEGEFLLDNPSDQLGLFIATYGTDWEKLNQWPGWDSLGQNQQLNLIRLIQKLDTILAVEQPLSPAQLSILEEEKRQELAAQRATELIEDELKTREMIRDVVWLETLRETVGDRGVDLYQQINILKDIKGLYDRGVEWFEKFQDPDSAVTGELIDDVLRSAGADQSPEDIAREAIKNINTIATAPSVYHYAYYREIYDQNVVSGLTPEQAHQAGMDALRERVNDYAAGEFGDPNDRLQQMLWGPATNRAVTEDGIYDRAFSGLNNRSAPRTNP